MIDVRYYRSIALRRLPLFLLIAIAAAALSFYVAIKLPPRYESSTRLLVESAQISGDLAASTVDVQANEQLQIFQQRLMTRANLLEIARKFRVYEDIARMSADRIVEQMREDTSIRLEGGGRDVATFMVMSYTADTPQIAAGVLNEYVTLILNENSEFRKSRASDTLDFFENEAERLNKALEAQSAKILVFQTDNKDALPSTLAYRLSRQSQLLERLNDNNRQKASLQEQKRRIMQLYEATKGIDNPSSDLTQDEQELDRLKDQLSQALLVYSNENPKVRLLQARVDTLQKKVDEVAAERGTVQTRSEAMLTIQVEGIDKQIEDLEAENDAIESELSTLVGTIERTPGNEISLDSLEREYKILETQYNAAVQRLNTAATGERIEVLSKGERVTVVDQPSVPDQPSSPNRKLIAAGGSVLGIAGAVGLIFLLEILNTTVRRPVDLTARFGIAPLAVLPIVRTPADRFIANAVAVGVVSTVVLGLPLVLFLVHTYYLPLDLIADKAMAKLGI